MDRTRNSVTMDNSIQEKIKHLSDEIKELAALIWSEKRKGLKKVPGMGFDM